MTSYQLGLTRSGDKSPHYEPQDLENTDFFKNSTVYRHAIPQVACGLAVNHQLASDTIFKGTS
ncbi:MAG: hypothetical protein OXI61_11185 [Candidatus Poribacteria bacterium]|nr:hypothetical protein [Candidatus Poribacteria bacterium]